MIESKVNGLPDLRAQLKALPIKLRNQALRQPLAAGARVVRDEARRLTPVLDGNDAAVRAGRRKPGTLRNAISVRTSKRERKLGNVGVFVNVRPAPKSQRGANSPNDPFYWRWVEFGRRARAAAAGAGRPRLRLGLKRSRRLRAVGAIAGFRMLTKAAAMLPQALRIFIAKAGPAIQRLAQRKGINLPGSQ